MNDSVTSPTTGLTAGFAPAEEADWRALVDKTLAGASFEKRLVSRTYDGIDIQPLYTADNAGPPLADALRDRRPFDADRAWDIRAIVDHPDPAQAQKLAMTDLEGGATSLLVKIDPTGEHGVAIGSKADLEQALDGVLLDLAPVALDAGLLGPAAAGWLHEIAHSKTLKPHLHLHLDPLSAFAREGRAQGPIAAHMIAAAEAGVALDANSAFLASGQVVHEAGGADAQEIAVMAAAGLAYAKAMAEAGLGAEVAIGRIALSIAVDADYFAGIAKIRTARAVWERVVRAICASPGPVHVEARSSRRMLSTQDPWVNMLRLTSAAFGASVGGADAIVLDPFTQPLGRPTPFARRQARNIQLVLMEEAHLGRVVDPVGGAWYIETLTDQLARAAWTLFQEIERQGGLIAALSSSFIADQAGEVRAVRAADIAKRKSGLVGVSEFPNLSSGAVQIDSVDGARFAKPSPTPATTSGADATCPPLKPWRLSEGFEHLRKTAAAMTQPPSALLATIGAPSDYTARVGFARNALAAGGIDAGVVDASAGAGAQTSLAVICGSDAGYAERGVQIAQTLKANGAKHIWLAGRPGALEAELKAAGVEGFLFAGADIEASLAVILAALQTGAAA